MGETDNFRERMNNHSSQCYTGVPAGTPFFIHREDTNHDFRDFHLYILKAGFPSREKRLESFMITKFDTMHPKGLNKKLGNY